DQNPPDDQPIMDNTHSPVEQLVAWLNDLPGKPAQRAFFVVSRTDDLATVETQSGNDAYNKKLSQTRLAAGLDHFNQALALAGMAQAPVYSRVEQDPWVDASWPPAHKGLLDLAPARIQHDGWAPGQPHDWSDNAAKRLLQPNTPGNGGSGLA